MQVSQAPSPNLMSYINLYDVNVYLTGSVATGMAGTFAGLTLVSTATFALLLPALMILIVNLPKILRDCILLYREIKRKNTDPDREG